MQYRCKSCGIVKDATEYRIHKKGYRVGKCLQCERDYQRAWYASQGERARKIKREYMARRRAANPEATRAYQRTQHARNREKRNAYVRELHGRRLFWSRSTRLKGIVAKDLARLWKKQKGLCALTGRRLDRSAQVDHITPKARGGSDSLDNLRWVCAEINILKRHLTDGELLAVCRDVVRWIGERIALVEAEFGKTTMLEAAE